MRTDTIRNVRRMDDGHVLEEEATRAWSELQLQVQNRDDGVLGRTPVRDEDMLARTERRGEVQDQRASALTRRDAVDDGGGAEPATQAK
jgi:hypothetical protein